MRLIGEGWGGLSEVPGQIAAICHHSLAVLFLQDLHSNDCFLRFAIATMPQLQEPVSVL